MFIPVSYEELAEYNKELTKSTKLPVYFQSLKMMYD